MAENLNFDQNNEDSSFIDMTDEDIDKLLDDSKSKNTNRSTNSSLNRFKAFLKLKQLPPLEDIKTEDLPQILTQFYGSVRTKKSGEMYQTSSFEVLRAGLNRYFKRERNVDIVADDLFVRTNLVFDGVQVKAKKSGKGVTRSYPHITKEDLKRIAQYFNVDYTTNPNPRILQECVQFFIMYFFCHCGQENLQDMTKSHFTEIVDYDGTSYIIQAIDEKDKNHRVQDTEMTNQAKMFEDKGK